MNFENLLGLCQYLILPGCVFSVYYSVQILGQLPEAEKISNISSDGNLEDCVSFISKDLKVDREYTDNNYIGVDHQVNV